MDSFLACRMFQRELDGLGKSDRADYFEPMCHRLRESEFSSYVESLAHGHGALLCGDCGGLSRLAASKGIQIPPYEDCIDISLPRIDRDPETLYLTDGWIDHFDSIFGLDRVPSKARNSVLRSLFSGILRVAYISTDAATEREEDARELAELLDTEFLSFSGSLLSLVRYLEELE